MDLLFLGHRDTTITIAPLAPFFRLTKNTARPKPGGTEPDVSQTTANRMKGQLLVLCELAYLSSFSSLFLVATNPCVCDTPEASLDT